MADLNLKTLKAPANWISAHKIGDNPPSLISKTEQYVKYDCGECGKRHSVRLTVRKWRSGDCTIQLGKTKVTIPKVLDKRGRVGEVSMLFGVMKCLDGEGIQYHPNSIRVEKL